MEGLQGVLLLYRSRVSLTGTLQWMPAESVNRRELRTKDDRLVG